ncbi:Rhodanese-like domain containing protein [Perkinsela sp. CCAP 1560/4]|nr:Rhodanese-like domain containing protein [Perkinsela sp. CCAP 1560/4]|eukprot:KNH04697.1 Rhodanese-like domain containing protein [Perkinsela sp. CCAP 1560/4]
MTDSGAVTCVSPANVAEKLASDDAKEWLIIDVRDEDRRIGWLPQTVHLPSATLSVPIMEKFITQHTKPTIPAAFVFHCMHSQQRAVRAANLCQDVVHSMLQRHLLNSAGVVPKILIMSGGYAKYHVLFPDRVQK